MSHVPQQLQDAIASRYVVEREVGRGGMATVYLARDLKHDRPVAVKVLLPALGALLGAERFLREIKMVARLQHPHILPLYDSGDASGMLYYVMPYVPGESLRGKLRREQRLPLRDALWIARNVADALYYAHANDIVHRDIKPENILLSGTHAIVADFGIARAVHVAGGEQWETLTESGVAIGTPAYMSPEQTVGESDIDGRSDIYSLGCVLFEMLAGMPPFTGPDGQVLLAKRFTDAPPSIRIVRDDVPPVVDAAIAKALAREPADRFANALDLTHAIWEDQHSSSGVARQPEGRRLLHRRGWLVGGGVGVAVVLGGFLLTRNRPETRQGIVDSASRPPAARDTVRIPAPPVTVAVPPPITARHPATETPTLQPQAHPAARPRVVAHQPTQAVQPAPDTVLATLRRDALLARTQAVRAGVPIPELSLGDSLLRTADTSAAAGRRSEAIVAMSDATGAWVAAARARTRTALDSSLARRDVQPVRRAPAESASAALRAPAAESAATRAGGAEQRASAPDPRAEIRALFDSYARAIESRSVPAIAQLYPTMSDTQQRDWVQFFNTVRDVSVHLRVTRIDVAGNAADAHVDGTYAYTNTSTRRIEQRPVTFHASLVRDAAGWRVRDIQ